MEVAVRSISITSISALQMWFGGYLLFTFPDDYEFKDFLIANFAILFSLIGLGAAFQDISDRKEVEMSAGRIFYLLDRVSEIDPLSVGRWSCSMSYFALPPLSSHIVVFSLSVLTGGWQEARLESHFENGSIE
jgi:hypothetical protein